MKPSALAALLVACAAMPAAGQNPQSGDTIVYGLRAPDWAGQVATLGANALFGGLTAGVLQELRGGSFKDGFTRGVLGGSVTYVGKRVAARRFDGAGLVGREISAVGASIVRNASAARPTFESLVLPLGPLNFRVTPKSRDLSVSLDVMGAAYLVYGLAEPELHFQAGESLSAGAPIFHTDNRVVVSGGDRRHAGGYTPAGVVLQSFVPAWGTPFLERVAAHERVHVLQEDQLMHTLVGPGTAWLLRQLPYGSSIAGRIDVNLSTQLLGLLNWVFPTYIDRPWELEAVYLSR